MNLVTLVFNIATIVLIIALFVLQRRARRWAYRRGWWESRAATLHRLIDSADRDESLDEWWLRAIAEDQARARREGIPIAQPLDPTPPLDGSHERIDGD